MNLEEDFETTLGGLVEHFANLPPARYGEPPDLVSDLGPQLASHAPNRRSWAVVWVTACAVVLGGGIALGSYLGWSYLRRPEPRSTLVKPATPDVGKIKIVVKATPTTKGVPQAEPLVDDRAAATPVAATPVAATPVAVPSVKDDLDEETPVKPKPIVRKIRRQRQRVTAPVGAAAAGADGDGWEDPYR